MDESQFNCRKCGYAIPDGEGCTNPECNPLAPKLPDFLNKFVELTNLRARVAELEAALAGSVSAMRMVPEQQIVRWAIEKALEVLERKG